jgi:aquaporin Z
MATDRAGRNFAGEFVATTIVMLGGPGLVVLGGDSIGTLELAIGFGVSIALAIGVIGAVANPMFSLALLFARAISPREAAVDWAGQFVGGAFGALLVFGMNDTTRFTSGTNGWEPANDVEPGVDLGIHLSGFGSLGVVLAAELIIGAIVTVVLLSSISQQRSNATMAAFTGAAYGLAMLFLVGISGGGINPARSLGTALFADTDPNALTQVWAFVLVPIASAFAGMLVWLAIDDATVDDTIFDDTILDDAADAVGVSRDD